MTANNTHSEEPAATEQTPPSVKRVTTDELMEGHRIIEIVHGDKTYRLCVTRTNTLILTA